MKKMKLRSLFYSAGLAVLLAPLSISLVLAQDTRNKPKDGSAKAPAEAPEEKAEAPIEIEENVKTGIIANTGNYGNGPQAIEGGSGDSVPGEETSPISASVSQKDKKSCVVSVSNDSKQNSYAVRYKAIGYNASGAKVLSRIFSDSLKPGETESHDFSCEPGLKLAVDLTSATKR